MTKPTGRKNPTHVLTEDLRLEASWLAHLGVWSKTAIANSYGVHRKTVDDCMKRWVRRPNG